MSSSFRHYATGAGAIAEVVTPGAACALIEVRLHLSAAGGAVELFEVRDNSGAGAVYDIVLRSWGMNLLADVHWLPDRPILYAAADTITFAYTNSNGRTWGLEVIWQLGSA